MGVDDLYVVVDGFGDILVVGDVFYVWCGCCLIVFIGCGGCGVEG